MKHAFTASLTKSKALIRKQVKLVLLLVLFVGPMFTYAGNDEEPEKKKAKEYVNFKFEDPFLNKSYFLTITDSTGQVIESDLLSQSIDHKVNVTVYKNGKYNYQLKEVGGNFIQSGTFVIAR